MLLLLVAKIFMICDKCHKNKACHSLLEPTNNGMVKYYLCDSCAERLNLLNSNQNTISLNNFLDEIFQSKDNKKLDVPYETTNNLICSHCQSSYTDFVNTGKLGCPHCYQSFFTDLKPLLRQIHGSITHVGKIPHHTQNKLSLKQEIAKLQEQIQICINTEEFEQAAIIRDRIKTLQRQLNASSAKIGGYLSE